MRILNIQRMSTEDGPGLRTTLFAKGCPLRCAWCHNPESMAPFPEIEWLGERCIGCRTCIKVCPAGALAFGSEGLAIDRSTCDRCLLCTGACPARALEQRGEERAVSDLFGELIKDRAYFGEDGGITLSGGEIMALAEEAAELLRMLKEHGIGTAVDTCGYCRQEDFEHVLPWTDIVLYDLKIADSDRHRRWTGVGNSRILANFEYIADRRKALGLTLWIRTPVIPGATDREDNIRALARLIAGRADRWELLAFNNLGRDKYKRLGRTWPFAETPLMTKERMETLVGIAHDVGCTCAQFTGMTALES